MKKIIIAALLALSLAPAFSIDFGLDVKNDTAALFASDENLLTQEDRVSAWLSFPVGAYSSLFLSGYGAFHGEYLLPAFATDRAPYFDGNAGRIEWNGLAANLLGEGTSLGWSVGRFQLDDYSGRVVSGLYDGAAFDFNVGNYVMRAAAAFTGLQIKEEADVIMDADDIARWDDAAQLFAPKRLLAELSFRAIEVLPKHDFGLDAWAQFDLEGDGDLDTHTQYVMPFIEGRIGRSLRWRAWGAAEFGYDVDFFMAAAAGTRVRFALPELSGLRVTQSFAWASGDTDGSGVMRAFTPITTGNLSTVSNFAFSDSASASLELSVSPLSGVSLGAGGAAIFRASLNDALGIFRDDASSIYLGSEASVRVIWKPTNDIGLSCIGGVFFPNNATAYESTVGLSYLASVSASLSL